MSFAFESVKDNASPLPEVAREAPKLLPDAALPQMEVVRDASMMRCVLQRALFGTGSGHQIEDCNITYIHYWPGETCLIGYRIAIRDFTTGQEGVQRLAARILPPGLSEGLFSEASRRTLVSSPFCDPVLHVSDLGMVIWLFPNDPKLEGIPALIDEILLRDSVLPRLVAEDCGPDWSISEWHTEVVSYAPEQRCTLRVVVQLQHKAGDSQTRTFYGKVYPDHTGRKTMLNMESLRKTCTVPFARFCIARPLFYTEESKILWQTGLAGTPLSAMKAGSASLLDSLANTGRVIAALHGSSLECPDAVQYESPLERLARAREILSHAEHCSTCLPESLAAAAQSSAASPRSTVHRDLHLQNILSTDDGIALVDLDNLAIGDAVEDVARFVAHLCSLSLGRKLDGPQIEPMVRAVVRSYVEAVPPGSIDEGEFRWHTAAALIYQQACRCVTRPRRTRLANLNNIIHLAERVANGGVL